MAAYVALIARYTGWTEKHILWNLPMARGNAYCHAFMRMQNVNTEAPENRQSLARMLDEI